MKKILILFVLALIFFDVWAQAPSGMYGEYKYEYSISPSGSTCTQNTFPRISPAVVTTNFGFVQSSAFYSYLTLAGTWGQSSQFSWAGYQNGYYVYTYRFGNNYSYLLFSDDFETVRVKESFMNGYTHQYAKCDPNERMNNAPTY